MPTNLYGRPTAEILVPGGTRYSRPSASPARYAVRKRLRTSSICARSLEAMGSYVGASNPARAGAPTSDGRSVTTSPPAASWATGTAR
jgi:hypothetical protein